MKAGTHHLSVVLTTLLLGASLTACVQTPTRPAPADTTTQEVVSQPPPKRPATKPRRAPIPPKADAAALPLVETFDAIGPEFLAPDLERLRARLANQLSPADCVAPATQHAATQQLRRPAQLTGKLERVAPALDYVLSEIERKGLPAQYALIPWAESGFRADPGNRGQVQGMWQFTAGTGRAHGLRIDSRYDGRRTTLQATDAALDHLQSLQDRFVDWRLVILAYNAGEYRVLRGLRGKDDSAQPTVAIMACADCELAPHSYAYLHKIVALGCILGDPQRYGVDIPDMRFEPLTLIPRPTAINNTFRLARIAGIEHDELLAYNAGFRNGDIADDAPYALLLPLTAAEQLRQMSGNPVSIATLVPAPDNARQHIVVPGENLWRIARRYRIALNDLLQWNGLNASSTLRPGQALRLTPR